MTLPLDPPVLVDRRQTIVQPPNNLQYIVAVIAMMLLGVCAVVAITLGRPNADNTSVIATIIGFLAPTTLSLLAFMKAQETHLSVNSRLDAFMANAKLAARAQGITEGRAQGRDAANARTDELAAMGSGAHTLAVAAPVQVEVINQPLTVKTTHEPDDAA